jgi:hypothetical protein
VTAIVVRLDDYRKRPTLPEPPRENSPPLTVAEAIKVCLSHPEVLNAWEAGFLASIRRLPRLSPKQLAVLQRIFDKVCAAAETWL